MKRSVILLGIWLFCGCNAVSNFIDSVDYQPPVINSLTPAEKNVVSDAHVLIMVDAENPESGQLTYEWETSGGGRFVQPADRDTVTWIAPHTGGTYQISVTVKNEKKSAKAATKINVQSPSLPVVNILKPADDSYFVQGDSLTVLAHAAHDNGLQTVRFYLAGRLAGEQDYNPDNSYTFKTLLDSSLSGKVFVTIWAQAFEQPDNTAADSVFINVEGILPGINGD